VSPKLSQTPPFSTLHFSPCQGQILKYYYSSATAKLLSAKLHINRTKPENFFVVTSESTLNIECANHTWAKKLVQQKTA